MIFLLFVCSHLFFFISHLHFRWADYKFQLFFRLLWRNSLSNNFIMLLGGVNFQLICRFEGEIIIAYIL